MKTNQTIEIKRTYFTSDLCLATILKLNNIELIEIEKPLIGTKFKFHFKADTRVEKIVQEYYNLSIEQHPFKRFFNEMKDIKNMIYGA